MINPALAQLNQGKMSGILGNLTQIKQMWNNFKSMGNPQAMVNNMLQKNPELKSIVDENGGDYQKAFYAYAEKLGVDGNAIIDALK